MSDPNTPDPKANNSDAVIAELRASQKTLTDTLNNMKAELNRKVSNIEARVTPQKPQAEEEPLEDLIYSNPKKVIETIRQQVNQDTQQTLNARDQHTQVIGDLMYDFPELQDKNSDLFKAAVAGYQAMTPQEQQNPMAYKLAVKSAAVDIGVKPRSKRSADDDFSLSGDGSSGNTRRSNRRDSDELSDASLEFAKRVGFNVDDPKVVERIQARAKRTNWNRYE